MPKPFLKWAGGKGQLLDQFQNLYPPHFTGYHEPFLGSGAVFFHLYGLGRFSLPHGKRMPIRLTDSNAELVNCYAMVRDCLDELVSLLADHRAKHSKEHYLLVRSWRPDALGNVERAARFIYLNKTCFNGLYRVNKQGQFNVPMGSYSHPRIFDRAELQVVRNALRDVELEVVDFRAVVNHARPGHLIYFDPPYMPLNKTSSFTSYTEDSFGAVEQRDLHRVFAELAGNKCHVMLSNSWVDSTRELYREYTCIPVSASRAINSKAERRGKINELVVLSYPTPRA